MGPLVLTMLVAFAAVGLTMFVRLRRNPESGTPLNLTARNWGFSFGFTLALLVLSIILVRWVI